ncbi:P-loop containing nucleoside triphosphate hydrolase protein [Crepidotus variabilis]|uniref:Kinesin-like protein n=1 Tax=Crepidotus variabilis TaxID=179855 RepID=A0A9P6EGM4_9AGAR|nr:P-loop containing nucleoside triphosphate hydrolase protein [Crepidotus variabilis]
MSIHKVKIITRLRPRINGEIDDDSVQVVHASDNTSSSSSSTANTSFISVPNPRDPTQIFKFPFSSCYGQDSNQTEIYTNDVEPLLDVVYSGVTVTIFAYGVTSSGKTFTMQGTRAEPGVIPQVVQGIFRKKNTIRNLECSLSVSYMEIYKDEVYDLFVTRENAPKLPVRENDSGMVFVANLSKVDINSVEEFEHLYNAATKHRSVGATNLNRASSRSHAILTIEAKMIDPVANTTLTGKINLVDLAGSENNKLTGNDPARMAESAAINKSLSVLGQVVHALNTGATRIPYRNSKLTRLLQDALGGSSVGLLICNIAPGIKFRQDTLNTLNFAVRTKNVENRPVVNERDNRPAPRPHFAALPTQLTALKPATSLVQAHATSNVGAPTSGPSRGRQSLVPVSRQRRQSSIGGGINQAFLFPGAGGTRLPAIVDEHANESDKSGQALSEKDIDERISKAVEAAVEAEVTRRLAERERQMQEERAKTARLKSRSPSKPTTIPTAALTPLMKRHKDLDHELMTRLQELERKYERGAKETQLADVLSPVSKKKTGRAYVALARAHSEKGDLQVALDLYRKAETYVPDNIKLKERIIEIEWAVKNNQDYVPSPKPARKSKRKAKKNTNGENGENEHPMDVDERKPSASKSSLFDVIPEFGLEMTNMDSPNCSKRSLAELDDLHARTPVKRQKRTVASVSVDIRDKSAVL